MTEPVNVNNKDCHSPRTVRIVLPFGLTEIPDQDPNKNDNYSSRYQSHQERGHINTALLVLVYGQIRGIV